MFTGIIETVSAIQHIHDAEFTIRTPQGWDDIKIGDSIAINGVCLTVTHFTPQHFKVTVVPETLRCTTLGLLKLHSPVNLERSLPYNGRMGGHYVQGHVDAVAEIQAIKEDGQGAWLVTLQIPTHLAKYIVNKGYVAIDGMSITVIEASLANFSVTFIPHTQAVTITQYYTIGSKLNLEVDILSKYIEKLMESNHAILS